MSEKSQKVLINPPGSERVYKALEFSQAVRVGDTVALMGKEFTLHACHKERGNKDDITAWIYLAEAQELLGKSGQINAILALECLCAGEDALPKIRKEIAAILPGTQIIERGSRAIARAEARTKVAEQGRMLIKKEKRDRAGLRAVRERLASILTPVVVTACAVWIGVLGLTNVRFLPTQPREVLPEMLGAADVSLVTLHRHLGQLNVPSKTYSIMASGRPVLATVPDDSEIARLVREEYCGFWVPPEDPKSLAQAIKRLSQQPEFLERLGANARSYVAAHFDRPMLIRRYHQLLHQVACAKAWAKKE